MCATAVSISISPQTCRHGRHLVLNEDHVVALIPLLPFTQIGMSAESAAHRDGDRIWAVVERVRGGPLPIARRIQVDAQYNVAELAPVALQV